MLLQHSPAFHDDQLLLAASKQAGLQRSTDRGQTWTSIPLDQFWQDPQQEVGEPVIHSIAFSPAFHSDGTVFVSGYNLGLIVSYDHGQTFVCRRGLAPPRTSRARMMR